MGQASYRAAPPRDDRVDRLNPESQPEDGRGPTVLHFSLRHSRSRESPMTQYSYGSISCQAIYLVLRPCGAVTASTAAASGLKKPATFEAVIFLAVPSLFFRVFESYVRCSTENPTVRFL
jgi:hypothetical protein